MALPLSVCILPPPRHATAVRSWPQVGSRTLCWAALYRTLPAALCAYVILIAVTVKVTSASGTFIARPFTAPPCLGRLRLSAVAPCSCLSAASFFDRGQRHGLHSGEPPETWRFADTRLDTWPNRGEGPSAATHDRNSSQNQPGMAQRCRAEAVCSGGGSSGSSTTGSSSSSSMRRRRRRRRWKSGRSHSNHSRQSSRCRSRRRRYRRST